MRTVEFMYYVFRAHLASPKSFNVHARECYNNALEVNIIMHEAKPSALCHQEHSSAPHSKMQD